MNFIVVIALSFASVSSLAAPPKPARQVHKVKLALNWKPEPEFGGFYAADINGHFKKQGLRAEILPGGAGTPVVQMVAAGQIDFGIVSADEAVISRSRGTDVVAIFATYQTNPQGIMVHEESGIQSMEEAFKRKGLTLALQKGQPYVFYLQKKFAGARAQVVPYQGGITTFLNDKNFAQQCFVTAEPIEARRRGAKLKTFRIADEGFNPYTAVLVTRSEVVKSKPELVKALVTAVRAGWGDYLKNPRPANALMGKLNPSMSAQSFSEIAEAQKPYIETEETKASGLGSMTEVRWKELIDQLADLKIITKKPEAKSLFVNY